MDLEIPADINFTKADSAGAHFKFKDFFTRLKTVVVDKLQEKRSSDLLNYQKFYNAESVLIGHEVSVNDSIVVAKTQLQKIN